MANSIDSVTARARLKARRDAYWHKIATGCYIGFRKTTGDSTGSWIARYWDDAHRKQHFQSLGQLDEYLPGDRFDKAVALARDWFAHLGMGGMAKAFTVADACTAYAEHIRSEKGDKPANDVKGRFGRWVDGTALAKVELAKLKRDHIRAFRRKLRSTPVLAGDVERERAPDTINRDMSALRAALNQAFADGKVTSDFTWREDLKPIKNASRRRDLYLDRTQRRKLIDHASPEIAPFLHCMAVLPLRPGALASLQVNDFNVRVKAIRIGKDKAGADRRLSLPEAIIQILVPLAEGRPGDAPLLARPDGTAWNKDAWKGPIKDAARAAGLPPEVSAYTLRHSTITDLVVGGLDLLTVAKISGTSVAMIEKHYGHLRQTAAADALAGLVL